ncbi:protein FolC [Ancylostoma duodenale]|uniref:tetrahydrofolate synthase n=1 Tax=Ancylostoma duodenale TaxID=51022 RepID=A0A0C2GHP3_9BILA|nr:protein FolC [Ancylostoma duodenale]
MYALHPNAAILHLNSLQSNAANLQKIREKRGILQESNLPDTISKLNKCGIELDALDRLNVIHISGTKGKGSTCAFVESILRSAGFRTGLYTSPHLVHARERIRIDGKPISETLFAKHFFTVYNKLKQQELESDMPPYFKFLTLLSFHVFLEECVDVAIVEVGIGGEYDATNIVQHPVVCGITTLDIDHTSILGTTLPEIAWHKAGILKQGSPTVVTPLCQEAFNVVMGRASERGVELQIAPLYQSYSFAKGSVSAGIAGDHQKVNIALALQLARAWIKRMGREATIFPDATENKWEIGEPFFVPRPIVEAIESCHWRGRSQIVDLKRVRYYLDGAHTPKSMERHAFDYALFCPTALKVSPDLKSDLTNFNQSASEQRKRSQQCASTWKEIGTGEILVFDCITSTVERIENLAETEDLDVLVTGSLHLVGDEKRVTAHIASVLTVIALPIALLAGFF